MNKEQLKEWVDDTIWFSLSEEDLVERIWKEVEQKNKELQEMASSTRQTESTLRLEIAELSAWSDKQKQEIESLTEQLKAAEEVMKNASDCVDPRYSYKFDKSYREYQSLKSKTK